MLLRWSDDLIVATSATAPPEVASRAMQAFEEYADYNRRVVADRAQKPRDDLMSVLMHAEIDGERLERRRDPAGGAADPGRRRRDHAPRHHRRHGAVDPQPRRTPQAARRSGEDPDRGRGDAALGDADPEHEPHGDAHRRAARRRRSARATRCCCSTRRPTATSASSTPVRVSTSTASPTTTSPSAATARHFCLGASLARLELRVMFEELLAPPAGHRAGERRAAAAAAVELHRRHRVDAGGVRTARLVKRCPRCVTPGRQERIGRRIRSRR